MFKLKDLMEPILRTYLLISKKLGFFVSLMKVQKEAKVIF